MSAAPTEPDRRPGWLPLLIWPVLALLGVVLSLHAFRYWEAVDDAFISFRYAENLIAGHGLVFNPGERVEGYTDFLWVMLLAGMHVLGLALPSAAKVLGLTFTLACLPVLYWCGRRALGLQWYVALLPCAVLAASASVAFWAGGGLETPLFMLLITLALGLITAPGLERPRRAGGAGVVFGLATLTRPEAALLFFVGATLAAWRLEARSARLRSATAMAAGFAAVCGSHLAFRLLYYGELLPNTFYAKTALTSENLQRGLSYAGNFLLHHGALWLLPALAAIVVLPWRTRSRPVLPLVVVGCALVGIIAVGGDFMPHDRFGVPFLPWLVLLACTGAARLGETRVAIPGVVVAVLFAAAAAVPAKLWPDKVHRRAVSGVRVTAEMYEQIGTWLRRNRPANTLLAGSAMGRIPYHSGFRTIDMLGLTDRHIAHHGRVGEGSIGHQRHDSDYVLRRLPDIVVLEFGERQFQEFSPEKDIYTDKVYQLLNVRWSAWTALTDLVARRDFRLRYAPRTAEVKPRGFWFFFERDEILQRMREQIPLASRDARTLFQLGLRYRLHGMADEAVQVMHRVAELEPERPEPALNAAYFLYEADLLDQALTEFRRVTAKFPAHPDATYGMALVLHRLGRYREAIPEWERFLRQAPTNRYAGRARLMLQAALAQAPAQKESRPRTR